MWTLGESIFKKSEVPNLQFDTVIYYNINNFEKVILSLIDQYLLCIDLL